LAEKAAISIHVSNPTSSGKFKKNLILTEVGVFIKFILDKWVKLYIDIIRKNKED